MGFSFWFFSKVLEQATFNLQKKDRSSKVDIKEIVQGYRAGFTRAKINNVVYNSRIELTAERIGVFKVHKPNFQT